MKRKLTMIAYIILCFAAMCWEVKHERLLHNPKQTESPCWSLPCRNHDDEQPLRNDEMVEAIFTPEPIYERVHLHRPVRRRKKWKMKMIPEHYQQLKSWVFGYLNQHPYFVSSRKDAGIRDERIRWDCLWKCTPGNETIEHWLCHTCDYLKDDHIDTALRHIFAEWNIRQEYEKDRCKT